jgi:hypothetical protein
MQASKKKATEKTIYAEDAESSIVERGKNATCKCLYITT